MFEVYVERAADFSAARRKLADDQRCASSEALLAVHSAISWNDALLAKMSGKAYKSQDHAKAVVATEQECAKRRLETDGLRHLRKLVAKKSDVAYGDRRISSEVASELSLSAERFEAWAIKSLEKLQ
jgi:hypothetical protein